MTEPIAYMVYTEDGTSVYVTDNPTDIKEDQRALPLYTKLEWQGLTDGEIHDCFQNRGRGRDGLKTRKLIAAAIEAMLREKNT
jgi:hypothetical protein